MQTKRNHFFDILRIVSVLFVIASHYGYMFDNSPTMTFPREYLTSGIGRLGVSFFFMISGALACLSLQKYATREYYVRRIYSVLVPYNIVYFAMAVLFLVLGAYFSYPGDPLREIFIFNNRSLTELLPSLFGFDHYLHGVYGLNTLYFTGEWFIGCIIVLYALSPLIYYAMTRHPLLTMAASIIITLLAYNKSIPNPYWSAQVRISDFTFGMLFIHLQSQIIRYIRILAPLSVLTVGAGILMAYISHQPIRQILFPLAPVSLLFAAAFFFIVLAIYLLISPLINKFNAGQILLNIASRAYLIMLLQHVMIIFASTNVDMSILNGKQAVLLFLAILFCIELVSRLLKPLTVKSERLLLNWTYARRTV
ncbi:acyltransferase [Enterobacteriaceae bacterium H20N1]|uniref:Acyltransferase n=1 Tax=Dryocola boscaweniae TaxID=2925397 RepID=A0A9X2W6Y8_9ENTR|nr:acyltransferase [Dryocola boscaweniae]MCT4702069.1 acyltransferase [Dryocola boscaweniae]MCT4719487.1 acyltransferase [Dryocola boscaweniae]